MSPGTESTERLPLVPVDADDPVLIEIFDAVRGMGMEVPTLYQALGNSPGMLRAWTAFAWPLRSDATTPRELRELMIMRVAQLTAAPYEWLAHWNMAVGHGVAEEQLRALADWRQSDAFSEQERAALTTADELTLELGLSDGTWSELTALFEPAEIVELILTAAFYSCVSRVLGVLELDYPAEDPRLAYLDQYSLPQAKNEK